MPKVSVIIPTYNRSSLLKDAVQSVLAQTEKDFEVIIVDDGSTDETRNVVYNLNDKRVRYLYKINGGAASARNLGLEKTTCVNVAFLDSDDLWPVNYLEVMLSYLDRQRIYGLVYCSIGYISSDGNRIELRNKIKHCKSGQVTACLFMKGFVSPVASIIRREIIGQIRFDELLSNAEDSDFFLRLSLKTHFLYVPHICVRINKSSDSLAASAGINYNRVLSLERFYFRLGGKKYIPAGTARRKLSHATRKVAQARRSEGSRTAAIILFKHAIKYWPLDVRLYAGLFKALMLKKANDPNPVWQIPEPLPDIII